MTIEDIHAEMLATGAITIQSEDGSTHHILRRGSDWLDWECASDGSYRLQINIDGELHSAEEVRPITRLWQRWTGNNASPGQSWRLKDGTSVTIRPIRPEDDPLLITFHESLSRHSIYMRYFAPMQLEERIAHDRLALEHTQEIALIAESEDQILGVGRLSKLHGADEAEFALLVSDKAQGKGLGKELLRRLMAVGRDEKLQRISGLMLADNRDMQRICEKLSFRLSMGRDPKTVEAKVDL